MRPSKDYYLNRKKLLTLESTSIKYRPTVEDAWRWFHILNEQIFGNKLKPVDDIKIVRHYGTHAYYNYFRKCDEGYPANDMSFYTVFKDEKLFVEILAHEMIHHFQYSYNEPLGHGPSFWAWRDNLKLKGLTLHKVA